MKGDGIKEAANKAVELAKKKALTKPVHEFSKDAEEIIAAVESKLTGIKDEQKRFFAIKLLEKDDKIAAQMKSAQMFLMTETHGGYI